MKPIVVLMLALTLIATLGCKTVRPTVPDGPTGSALKQQLARADRAMREARLVDAEALYRDLAASHPGLPEIWLQLGNIYARQSQLEAAIHSYRVGLGFTPDDGRLWHNLALMELKQSINTLETASALLPATSPHHARIQDLHRALLRAGQPTVSVDR